MMHEGPGENPAVSGNVPSEVERPLSACYEEAADALTGQETPEIVVSSASPAAETLGHGELVAEPEPNRNVQASTLKADTAEEPDPDEAPGQLVETKPKSHEPVTQPIPDRPVADDSARNPVAISSPTAAKAMSGGDRDGLSASRPAVSGRPTPADHRRLVEHGNVPAPGDHVSNSPSTPGAADASLERHTAAARNEPRVTAAARSAEPSKAVRERDARPEEAERPLPRPFDGQLQAVDLREGLLIGDFRRRDAPVTSEGLLDGDVLADSPTVVLIDPDTAFVGGTYLPLLKYHHPILRAFRDKGGPLRTAELREYIGDVGELDEGRMRGDVVRKRAQEVMESLNRALGFRAIVEQGTPGKANINTFHLKDSRVKILEILQESRTGNDQPQPTADELYEGFSGLDSREGLFETNNLIEISLHPDSLLRVLPEHVVRVLGHARFILNVLGRQTGLVSPATVKAYGYRGTNDAKFSGDVARLRDYLNTPGGPEVLLSTGSYADRRIGLHPYVKFWRSLVELERPASPLKLQAPFPRRPRRRPIPVEPEPATVAEKIEELLSPSSVVVQPPIEPEVSPPPELPPQPKVEVPPPPEIKLPPRPKVKAETPTPTSELAARYIRVTGFYHGNRSKKAYRSPKELEAAVSELSGVEPSAVRDMVLMFKLSKTLRVSFGPDDHADEDGLDRHREAMFGRLDEALWSVPFINPRGRLAEAPLLALGLGLPPEISFLDQLQMTRPSGIVVPYQSIYQMTRERGNDFQRLGEIYDTEQEILANIYKRALGKLRQELAKAG